MIGNGISIWFYIVRPVTSTSCTKIVPEPRELILTLREPACFEKKREGSRVGSPAFVCSIWLVGGCRSCRFSRNISSESLFILTHPVVGPAVAGWLFSPEG